MRFLAPGALWWFAALGLVVLLYVVRRRARPASVTTLPFFKLLHRHIAESPWLRRLKQLLSFLISAAVLAAVVLALSRPVPEIGDDLPQGVVVVVVDRSASMGARDGGGPDLLERGLERVRTALAGVPDHVPVAIVASDIEPQVVQPFSRDRLAVLDALDGLGARPMPGRHRNALTLARHMAEEHRRVEIWWCSDREPPALDCVDVVTFTASVEEPHNAGITACALRRKPQERNLFEAFVEIRASHAGEVQLEVHEDGELTTLRKVEVGAGERHRMLLPVSAGAGRHLHLKLVAEGDVLDADDTVFLPLPEKRKLRIAWVAPAADGFTGLGLATLPAELVVDQMEPSQWPPERMPDVLVADGWLPEEWPEGPAGVVCIDPPGPVAGIGLDRLTPRIVEPPRVQREGHPLLFGVSSPRLAIAQTAVITAMDKVQPLWSGDAGVMMATANRGDQRIVLMGFDPGRSPRLALTASYPSLLANALLWGAQEDDGARAVRPCGEVVAHDAEMVVWERPDGSVERLAREHQILLDRVGIWRAGEERGAAALLDGDETMVGSAVGPAADEPRVAAGGAFTDWPRLLVFVVLALLLGEAWLCHRKGVF